MEGCLVSQLTNLGGILDLLVSQLFNSGVWRVVGEPTHQSRGYPSCPGDPTHQSMGLEGCLVSQLTNLGGLLDLLVSQLTNQGVRGGCW